MISWNMLAKYLTGEAGEKDKKQVEQWISKDQNNLKSFEEIKMYWNTIENKKEERSVDVDAAWDHLAKRIHAQQPVKEDTGRSISLPYVFLKYAAAVILLIGLGAGGFFAYQGINKAVQTVTVQTPNEVQKQRVFLPDGTLAYLHYDSRLNYPKHFDHTRRSIDIQGEVYFDVTRNPSRPFVISAKDARIEVLGTAFNVNTNFQDNKVEVTVESGKVKLSRIKDPNEYIILEPGYKGILNSQSIRKVKNTNDNYLSWMTGRLVFKGRKLEQVAQTLEKTYRVSLKMDDSTIKDYKLTTNFTDEPIDTVLAVIATTFDLEVDKKGKKTYVLRRQNQ